MLILKLVIKVYRGGKICSDNCFNKLYDIIISVFYIYFRRGGMGAKIDAALRAVDGGVQGK